MLGITMTQKINGLTSKINNMKIFKIIIFFLLTQSIFGQVSSTFSYQGYLINNEGQAIKNSQVEFVISISKDDQNSEVYYNEVKDINTSDDGIFNLIVGEGIPVTGAFNDIDWLGGVPYITIEYDLNNGQGLQSLGTTRFNAVPFCFSSKYVVCQAGADGVQGPQGEQGERGQPGIAGWSQDGRDGIDGVNGRPMLPLLNTPPTSQQEGTVYMDNGTNRTDGMPGFRYFDGSVWIDL